jgi:hypothetical protein
MPIIAIPNVIAMREVLSPVQQRRDHIAPAPLAQVTLLRGIFANFRPEIDVSLIPMD